MPFGISSAPEEFQRRMHSTLQGLPGVEVIADDILVYGCGTTDEECQKDHDTNLHRLLQRARDKNLKLNKKKLRLCLPEVTYMGHRLTKEGLNPDPTKIKAILDMPTPDSKKAVERFLGCLQYLSRFLPQLAAAAAPLRQLTERSAIFTWQTQQADAFQSLKKMITMAPVLRYYDVKTTVQCDASEKGLGATLLQKGQPVTFASRALNKSEQNYAQIEKECLAIVFACERFNQYIHGRESTTVHTDHRPLVPIFTKPIYNAPKRLQRMLLRLQKYNLQVRYQPGKEMYIADMLSRAYLNEQVPKADSDYAIFQLQQEAQLYKEIEQINPAEHVRLSEKGLAEIKVATQQDASLQELSTVILTGWPEHKNDLSLSIRAYWPFRDELTVHNNIIYKGTKILIPKSMQALMMQRTHSSHQGPEASVRRAKDVIFWPGMTSDIRHLASQCSTCNDYAAKQQKEPLISTKIPTRPWSIVAQDLFTLDNKSYLITVDFYSDFWELDTLNDTTSETIVAQTKAHFSRYGIPNKVISDNGPQFRSQLYEDFAKQWEFQHVTSSPYHSQSNGKAESAVKIAKKLLKKARQDKQDIALTILAWRNTPTEGGGGYSPAQKLHSRRTRTILPTSDQLLQPEVPINVQYDIQLRRQKAKQQYDKGAKQLPLLTIGQAVRIQPLSRGNKWEKATVLKQVGKRSYLVKTAKGQIFRRNRKYLRSTNEGIEPDNTTSTTEGEADEFSIPTTQDQQRPTTQMDNPTANHMENEANQTVTRTGRVVKPSSRYKDFVKL